MSMRNTPAPLSQNTPAPLSQERGQATIEYLIVGVALIVIITGLGALSGRLQEGLFVQHAADSASHAITVNTAGSAGDILLY